MYDENLIEDFGENCAINLVHNYTLLCMAAFLSKYRNVNARTLSHTYIHTDSHAHTHTYDYFKTRKY